MNALQRTTPVRRGTIAGAFVVVAAIIAIAVITTHSTSARRPQARALQPQSTVSESLPAAQVSPALRQHVAETYGKLPLVFETNQGQSDKQVKFLSRGEGYTLFLTGDEAVLSLRRAPKRPVDRDALVDLKPEDFKATNLNAAVLRMKLVGANPAAKISGGEQQEGKSNYFIGNDPSQWRTDVSNYSQVRYQDAYPGIDLVYYGNRQQLEYDFVVAPGTDPRSIALDVASESAPSGKRTSAPLRIADNGDLLVPTTGGDVRFHKPVVYQPASSDNIHSIGGDPSATGDSVDGRWVLKANNQVGFEISSYDRSRALVIDPVLSYSTYIGGSGTDGAFGVAIDQYGNAYVTGFTTSSNFPLKNAYQSTYNGGIDTFALKLNRTGTALVYSTYLGGSGTQYPFGMAVDSKGEAYEIGNTGSANFPVTPTTAFQATCVSCATYPAVFLTKFAAAGNALVYSTFLGGSGDNRAFGITLDSSEDAYIVGWTTSTDFPTTSGAFQTSYVTGAASNAFVSEINPAASGSASLVYSTYLGGSVQDVGYGIALDSSNNTIITGYTYSLNFPVTAGAFQTSTTTNGAAFVSKLNVGGTQLLYSTYLGGTTGTSAGNSVAVDSSGNAYIAGYTCATDFPVTANAVQSSYQGQCNSSGGNAFVTEINPAGNGLADLVYSTYLGGSNNDVAFSIGLDQNDNIYVTGRSDSTNFPVTPGTFQHALAGSYDAFYSIIAPGATSPLVYSTYLGGTLVDVAFVMAVDKLGNSYMIGRTYSTNFPVTPGAFQSTLKGTTNAIVYKFSPGDQAWPMSLNFGTVSIGMTSPPLTTTFTNSDTVALTMGTPTLDGTDASDYAISSNTCSSTLAPGSSCTISVTFTPATSGTLSAVLAINDSAANTPQSVALTGTGSTSNATLTPSSLAYATQVYETNSPSQPATLTNTGMATITISKIATTGPYSQTNNCGTSLAANASCTINVVFTPTKGGTQTGTLTVTDNAPNSPQTTTLSGVGTVFSFSPTSLNFGTQALKTSSPPQTVTLTNVGPNSVNTTKIDVTGSRVTSFIIQSSSTCPLTAGSLGAGDSCTVVVVFDPQLKGALDANITAVDAAGGSPQTVPMSGTGD